MVNITTTTCDICGAEITRPHLNYSDSINCTICGRDACPKCHQLVGKIYICKDHLQDTILPLRILHKIFNTNYGISYLESNQWESFKGYTHRDWLILNVSDDGEASIHLVENKIDANIIAADHAYHGNDTHVTMAYHNGNFYEPETSTTLVKK